MNRRIVLIDEIETPDYMSYFGIGLGNEIYTIQTLKNFDEPTRMNALQLGEGDAVMLVGSEPFNYLREFYHYGVRSENYYDCSELPRLSMDGGAFAKVIVDFPTEDVIKEFMDPSFCDVPDYSWFKSDIIHTYERACAFLDWIESLPEDEDLGFDYEGSGFPLDKWYELSGFSLCNIQFGAFVSLTDIRHELGVPDTETSTDERYNALRKRLAGILYKRMTHLFVYNMQYEYQASHRLLYYVDLYDLCDVSAINTITGHHLKKYSLKWSGQLYLRAKVWDAEFDYLSDLIDKMLFMEVGKLKKDKKKVLKVDKTNFESTPEWAEICKRYPQYIDEFRSLILEYWGNAFMCIPSDILGKYCNLDAFYTLLIYKSQEGNYSKECFDTFFDNTRLATRLANGLYIDEVYRKAYDIYAQKQMAYGITYCTLARCWIKMEKHKTKMADISKYHPVAVKLLQDNKFFQGNSLEIVKYILSSNIDTTDSTSTGLDEGSLALTYGFDFANALVDAVKTRMKEIKMKTKLDAGVIRKKKLLGLLAEDIKPMIGLDKMKIGEKHIELEKYLYYKRNYDEVKKVSERQLTDINNIPEKVYAFGREMGILEYAGYLSDNLFRCTSPEENDEIVYELMELYKPQTCFLAALHDSSQQLPETEKFYSSRGIIRPEDGFAEWMSEFNQFYPNCTASRPNWRGEVKYTSSWHSTLYPDKAFTLAIDHSKSMKTSKKITKSGTTTIYSLSDRAKEMWSDFAGWKSQVDFFPELKNEWREYEKGFDPSDFGNDFFFMRKFVLNYLLFKKYSKVQTTYVGDSGMLRKTSRWVMVDKNHIPIREADPGEPGAVEKLFIHYECQTKSSKRWSSPFHTIISHSDLKNAITVPPLIKEDGTIVYGGSDFMMTYFDIDKTVSFTSDSECKTYYMLERLKVFSRS